MVGDFENLKFALHYNLKLLKLPEFGHLACKVSVVLEIARFLYVFIEAGLLK
jgi:hypothetical protein